MMLQLVKFKCSNCKSEFKAPQLKVGSYAEFLLRSQLFGKVAHLDAMADSTYDEVDKYIKCNSRVSKKSTNALAAILRKSYGAIACDPDPLGSDYQIEASPVCPSCKSQVMEYWEFIEPSEFVDIDVPSVTHKIWASLTDDKKSERVDQVLSALGY